MVNEIQGDRTGIHYDVLQSDLEIMEAMAAGMADYLMSDATWWDMGRGDMPLLTVGGYLLRRRRLDKVAHLLRDAEKERLAVAIQTYDRVASGTIVRLEQRALSELGARMREWTVYLRDLTVSRRLAADTARYAYLADTRVVIHELIAKLSESPFRLPEHIAADVAMLDQRLRQRWKLGGFIWSPVWTSAYPRDEYWYLYGHPKVDRANP